jgi:3-oxoacyl-[acyl-carrier protein] reductase
MSRSILITGASKGIGRAAAEALAAVGWEVIGVARHAPANFPGQFLAADLSDPEATEELASRLAQRGNVLGIVNNVGIARHERFECVKFAGFASIMDLNVRPALQLTQALLAGMRNARFGRIVNVSSLVTRGLPFRTSYASAKAYASHCTSFAHCVTARLAETRFDNFTPWAFCGRFSPGCSYKQSFLPS